MDKVPCTAHQNLNGGTLSEYQPWCPACRAATAEANKVEDGPFGDPAIDGENGKPEYRSVES